jgi:hypothetical protein
MTGGLCRLRFYHQYDRAGLGANEVEAEGGRVGEQGGGLHTALMALTGYVSFT